jgi:hypothetical protein
MALIPEPAVLTHVQRSGVVRRLSAVLDTQQALAHHHHVIDTP